MKLLKNFRQYYFKFFNHKVALKNMNLNKFSLNGRVLANDKANISILNIEYQYGFGVYETVRVNDSIPFFLSHHINRLMNSSKIIGIEHPFSEKEIKEHTEKL